MAEFEITLQASEPSRNIRRFYQVIVSIDLLGDWLIEICYGRIGTHGHCLTYSAANEHDAKQFVLGKLRRRSTARRRIGIGYAVKILDDPHVWIGSTDSTQTVAATLYENHDDVIGFLWPADDPPPDCMPGRWRNWNDAGRNDLPRNRQPVISRESSG